MAQGGVEGGLDVADLAGGLGQEQPALQGGQEPRGELRGVGVGAQVAAVARRLQAAAEQGLPLGEAGGEVGAGLRVGLGQLPDRGAEAAAAIAAQLQLAGDVQLRPPLQRHDAHGCGADAAPRRMSWLAPCRRA